MNQKAFEFDSVDYTNGKIQPIGEQLRDAGMQRVLDNAGEEWIWDAYRHIAQHHRGKFVTGEIVRQLCTAAGIVPHHPNAWGGLVYGMVASGLLTDTDEETKMQDSRSHARKTSIYQVTPNVGATVTQQEIITQIVTYEIQRSTERESVKNKHRVELKEFDKATRQRISELKQQAKEAK